jgi:hypothetical protein
VANVGERPYRADMTRLLVLTALGAVLLLVLPAAALAQERHSCGNYGYPEGYDGERPIFTDEPIVGAGVEGIRTRTIGCRKGRRMVKAFWNGRFDCNESGLRCTYYSFTCRNRRLGDEYWLMRCFGRDRDRMLKFRFGA